MHSIAFVFLCLSICIFALQQASEFEHRQYTYVSTPLYLNRKQSNDGVLQSSMHTRRTASHTTGDEVSVSGYLPSHLNVTLTITAPANSSCAAKERLTRTIFGPDDRFSFHSSNYPFSAIGRILFNDSVCTGTMIGRNLVLTASHCIPWALLHNTSIAFVPAYYEGEQPFGEVFGNHVYSIYDVNPGNISALQVAFDMAIIKLESDVGNFTGWAGATEYSSLWNGGKYWTNVGYPVECFDAERPVVTLNGSIDEIFEYQYNNFTAYRQVTHIDMHAGNSGGPIFSYFDENEYISVIGVFSSDNAERNSAAGGPALISLIKFAREQAS